MNKLSTIIFIIAAIIASTNAAVVRDAPDGIIVTVDDINTFCSFLPRTPGEGIGASEGDAVAFCTQNTPKAPGARIFPPGFLKTAVFLDAGSYVQVTGTINPEAYSLSRGDGGGQYDSVGAPPNAQCAGYQKFVNLVEPDLGTFCIRCCHDPKDCDTGHSTAGCASIIPPPS